MIRFSSVKITVIIVIMYTMCLYYLFCAVQSLCCTVQCTVSILFCSVFFVFCILHIIHYRHGAIMYTKLQTIILKTMTTTLTLFTAISIVVSVEVIVYHRTSMNAAFNLSVCYSGIFLILNNNGFDVTPLLCKGIYLRV